MKTALKFIKQNIVLKILVSILFGIASFYDSRLIFTDDIFATPDKVFFLPVTGRALGSFVFGFVVVFVITTLMQVLQEKFSINYERNVAKLSKKDYLIWPIVFVLLIVCWLPYILSYFPGGIYPDTATCIGQARSGEYNNQQPLLYTFIFKFCTAIAGDLNAVMLFSVLQIIFMAACFSYIIFRLYLHKINKPVLIAIFAYFALYNLVPLYVVSLWKDTLYSVTLLMYIFLIIERIILRGSDSHISESDTSSQSVSISGITKLDIISILVWMVLTVFLRNNGIYVMFLSLIIFAIAFRKSLKELKLFFIPTVITLVICYIIQGPVFSKLHLNGPFVENLGVLQQQVAYVEYIGGEITPEQAEFLNQVCPLDTMKAYYRPFDVDVIKWCEQYDNKFLEANKVEFLKVWVGMLKNNPKLYVDAYLYSTLGYWNPYKQLDISYVNPEMWDDLKTVDRYWQRDILEDMGISSKRESLIPETLVSSAAFLFITLILFVLSINKKDKSFTAFVPALGTYLTVFIATPLAFALRYVYIVVLTLPIFIVLVFIRRSSDK